MTQGTDPCINATVLQRFFVVWVVCRYLILPQQQLKNEIIKKPSNQKYCQLMKKASVHILFLFATLNVFAQTPAHVDVWGMRPEAGHTISGHVYLDSIASANCIVMEKDAQGKTVNATCTDENGCFSLKTVNPDDIIQVSAYAYSPKQKKMLNYKANVKHAGSGFMGYDDFRHEINGRDFNIWLNDGVEYLESYSSRRNCIGDPDYLRSRQTPTQRPLYPVDLSLDRYKEYREQHNLPETRFYDPLPRREEIELLLSVSGKDVISSGKIPEAGDTVTGFVMDKAGAMSPVLITERDSENNIVSQTETLPNGEFTLKVADPSNHICILIDGYHEIRQRFDGDRLLINMQEGNFSLPGEYLPFHLQEIEEEQADMILVNLLEESYQDAFFRPQTHIISSVSKSRPKPKAGDVIRGSVYVNDRVKGGCIVAERNKLGKLVNVTATDGLGVFMLRLTNPHNRIWIYHSDYVPFKHAPSGYFFEVNLLDTIPSNKGTAWAKVQRAEKRSVIASGRKPEYGGDWIEGFVMDANGVPLRNAVVTEIDSNGKVVSETKTFKNGEFLLYQTNPDNRLKVSHDGYNDVITKADGVRLVTLMNNMKNVFNRRRNLSIYQFR